MSLSDVDRKNIKALVYVQDGNTMPPALADVDNRALAGDAGQNLFLRSLARGYADLEKRILELERYGTERTT